MRIVPKLTVVLVAGMCVVLGINGYQRVRRETESFEQERARRHRRAGVTMSAAMIHTWKLQDEAAAVSTMEAIATGYPTMQARWVPGDTPFTEASTNVDRTQDPETWWTYVPIRVDGVARGHVELSETATADAERARSIVYETIKAAGALVALSAIIAFFVGHWVVGKPVRRLAEKARRIGRGDFDDPLERGSSSDELAELAGEMNAMCERLKSTLEQLRHADRLVIVGRLASGVAHELGTPLNVVTARSEMIMASRTATQESREYASAIHTAAERMTGIISQLLQFARRKTVERAHRDVGALVRDTVDLLRPLARKRDVGIEVEAAPVDAFVDSAQLQQVVTNLVMNAVHASAPKSTIEVRVSPKDDSVCIEVKDEGSGIAPADLPRIFEPFFTTKTVGEGTGLGLAVTHGIVREHQGWLDVESTVGVGSTFKVILPRGDVQ